jgi:uncharacterized protein (DUF1015 family)
MTKIRPFKAVIFNQNKVKDYSLVVCPPYDVISPAGQQVYHQRSIYNFLHILLAKDIAGEDKYSKAGETFRSWLKADVLVQENNPALYFYSQQYIIRGEKRTRLGFISLLKLGDKKESVVFGHEHTHTEAKEDRLKLIKQVKANLSPIFVIFLDKKRIIQRIFQKNISHDAPFIQVTDDEKTVHKLWRLDQPEIIESVVSSMNSENMFIADGHHRYEVACAYRDLMREELGDKFTAKEDFNYCLSYFTNTDPRGLSILPIHRLLKLTNQLDLNEFQLKLKEHFDILEVKENKRFFFLMEKAGFNEHLIGMYKDKRFWLLRLKNVQILDQLISDKPKEYRALDVSILNYLVFKEALGLDLDHLPDIKYSPDANELINAVDEDSKKIAFFLNPVKMEQIIAIALNGSKMPPKSTYFYPKVLSGLVINKLST